MRASNPEPEVRSAGAIRAAEGSVLGKRVAEWRRIVAAELGIPGMGIVVGTGHQAGFWHPGILAKYIWADELAQRHGGTTVHLVVDSDEGDPLALRLPVMNGPVLGVAHHTFGASRPRAAALAYPATAPSPLPGRLGTPVPECTAHGARRLAHALANSASQPNAALQAWAAMAQLLSSEDALFAPAPSVATSALLATSLGRALLQRALEDPRACVETFNAALAMASRAARPLRLRSAAQGFELPFWRIDAGGARHRMTSAELASAHRNPGWRLAPTALVTGAFARVALCDRFVHGTGGERYERATEHFIRHWLGAELPAFDTVTATLRLPFEAPPERAIVTAAERRRAYFDPSSVFAADASARAPSPQKQEHLREIARLPRSSTDRRNAWKRMHAELGKGREQFAGQLDALTAREAEDRQAAAEQQIRSDRTWPAPFYPADSLTRMARQIRLAR